MQSYRCWSCGEKGDVFSWVMKTENVDFRDALKILAEKAGVKLTSRGGENRDKRESHVSAMESALTFFREQYTKSEQCQKYCEDRGLTQEILDHWELGYAPATDAALASHLGKAKFDLNDCRELFLVERDSAGGFFDKFRGRLIFPIRNDRGILVAFGGRIIGDGQPKYINSSNTPLYNKSKVLYGFDKARKGLEETRRAVLVEGYTDVIACHRAGINTAVASLGTSLAEDHVNLLKRWCDEVVILYDSDEAGQKAADRASDLLTAAEVNVKVVMLADGEDPDTLLTTQGSEAVLRSVEKGVSPLDFRLSRIAQKYTVDDREYWNEVSVVLAREPDPRQVEMRVLRLAPTDPEIRDPERAATALRELVARAKKGTLRRERSAQKEDAKDVIQSPPAGLEVAVFKGLLDEKTRQLAWNACLEPDLFISRSGRALARAIAEQWPEQPPQGEVVLWVDQLPEEAREILDLTVRQDIKHEDGNIDSAVALMEEKRTRRVVRTSRTSVAAEDDSMLQKIQERLQSIAGDNRED